MMELRYSAWQVKTQRADGPGYLQAWISNQGLHRILSKSYSVFRFVLTYFVLLTSACLRNVGIFHPCYTVYTILDYAKRE